MTFYCETVARRCDNIPRLCEVGRNITDPSVKLLNRKLVENASRTMGLIPISKSRERQ